MATLNPPPLTDDPNLNRWLNLLHKQVLAVGGLGNYVNDAAAAAGGVPIGGAYRNGSVLMIRVA